MPVNNFFLFFPEIFFPEPSEKGCFSGGERDVYAFSPGVSTVFRIKSFSGTVFDSQQKTPFRFFSANSLRCNISAAKTPPASIYIFLVSRFSRFPFLQLQGARYETQTSYS